MPNVMPPIIIIFSITIGTVIITEASLSFLGFGLPLSVPSWGGLLSREGRRYMQVAPWLAMWPGIFLTVVGVRLQHVRRRRCATCSTRACAAAPAASPAPAASAASLGPSPLADERPVGIGVQAAVYGHATARAILSGSGLVWS